MYTHINYHGRLLFYEHYQDEFKKIFKDVVNNEVADHPVLEKKIDTIKENLPQDILDMDSEWEEEVRKWRNEFEVSRSKNYIEFLNSLVDDRLIYILNLDGGEDELDTMLSRLYPVMIAEQSELIQELKREICTTIHRTSLFK